MTHHLYLFSDATGETVERVVRAVTSQFRDVSIKLHRFGRLRTEADILQAVGEAARQPGMILYTLVNAELARFLAGEVEANGLEAVDLLSPLLFRLSDFLGISPQQEPGLLHQINADYHKRVEAVNFTVKQDDGQELRNLHKADIVLVGVSRSSKTPLSMYLAHKGYRVANVPLVRDIPPPRELDEIDQKKIVGLIIDPKRLVELRAARLRNLRQGPRGSYADYERVEEEIEVCRRLYRKHPEWLVVDVTNKSVEEAAAEILKRLNNVLID
jgi:regulator of PEP synthase PpsR (kinase-PPPase family)